LDTYVDSSVLLDLMESDSTWGDWSEAMLFERLAIGNLLINPIVYSEISIGFTRVEELEVFTRRASLTLRPFPKEALFLAGKAFVKYKRRGGTKTTPLPDFYIGAQSATERIPLLTRDPRRIREYFPTVEIISP
jgi:predicted nucleic acid-binding protein